MSVGQLPFITEKELVHITAPENTHEQVLIVEQSLHLAGEASLFGAKNAVLVIMASLLLTQGKNILRNVPGSEDVHQMIKLLQSLGASIHFDISQHILEVDTTLIERFTVPPSMMKRMRASVLVMGPLLGRFGRAEIALPGGCSLGARPIDFHLRNLEKMGVHFTADGEFLTAVVASLKSARIVLEYPSVGATENILMAATVTPGVTTIVNAALEPEVLNLIEVLRAMGAQIEILPPATLRTEGVSSLKPIEHDILPDRLEAGALLLAAAVTGGSVYLPSAQADVLDVFLAKLEEMGHRIEVDANRTGIRLTATQEPRAVSFRTGPYPGFPTDLQAPMMAIQCVATGSCEIQETVFENRFLHVRELQKMGAHITLSGDRVRVQGVDALYGGNVIASDIRASCALVLAGLVAKGHTVISGIHHWRRGYERLETKLAQLGAKIALGGNS